jgi:hypothetical protein
MSELNVYHHELRHNEYDEFYLKSETDKVIAEKDKEIATLKDKLRHYPIMAALLESDKKEIAELEDKLQSANEQIENLINSASSIMLFQDSVNDNKCAELRHQKFKRCLAMARQCHNESLWWYSKGYGFEKYDKFWEKWEKRWLELAEKFKEAQQ